MCVLPPAPIRLVGTGFAFRLGANTAMALLKEAPPVALLSSDDGRAISCARSDESELQGIRADPSRCAAESSSGCSPRAALELETVAVVCEVTPASTTGWWLSSACDVGKLLEDVTDIFCRMESTKGVAEGSPTTIIE